MPRPSISTSLLHPFGTGPRAWSLSSDSTPGLPLTILLSPEPQVERLKYQSFSCPVHSSPVLSCPILSSPVLPSPVLSYPLLSCPLLSCPLLSSIVLSSSLLSCPLLSYPLLSCSLLSCTVSSPFQESFLARVNCVYKIDCDFSNSV